MEDTAATVTRQQVCRHCTEPVTVAAPDGAPEQLGKAVHAGSRDEWCADGLNLAAPVDPDLTGNTRPKPTAAELGIDLSALAWERSGTAASALEVAIPAGPWEHGDWVLMRKDGDASGLVLVFDRSEWECFLDGVRNGEFDGAAEDAAT